jgi:hypothetical protein
MSGQELTTWMSSSPSLPVPHNPKSILGKFSKLLIWEERSDLLSQDPVVSSGLLT